MVQEMLNEALNYHREGRLGDAERLYRQILAREPSHPPALVHLALVAQATGRLHDAHELLERAVAARPGDAQCHNNLGNVLRELGHLAEAEASYRAALACDRNSVNAYFNLAALLMEGDDPKRAAECYRQVLQLAPDDADAVGGLGVALMALEQTEEAVGCFRRVTRLRPDDPRASFNLATALKDLGDDDAALDLYQRTLALNAGYSEAHNNIGLLLSARGQTDDATVAFREAIRSNPRHLPAYLNLAGLLVDRHDYAQAAEVARDAVAIDARHPRALLALGSALTGLSRFEEAERALLESLDVDTELSDARFALAQVYRKQMRLDEATVQYRAVEANTPAWQLAQNNLGVCLMNQGRFFSAMSAFSRALDADPGYAESHSNMLFCSNYMLDVTPSRQFALHRRWARRHTIDKRHVELEIDRDASRVLHVGYVSPDLCNHSVAHFIEPLIAGHDRGGFKITCYSDVAHEDAYTDRIRELADQWRDLHGLDHDAAGAVVRGDRVDILVDLAGHTSSNRMPMFARRVAPIQVSYLGYPNTTGLDEMDYRVTDAIADPPGESDNLHSETLVRLSGGFLCYQPPRDGPPVSEPPALSRDHVTFGSFNNPNKINEGVVSVWSRILNGVPGSRLLLKARQLADAGARRRLQRLFAAHGVDGERLEMTGPIAGHVEHLSFYANVDVALDPFPYNGTTTTCEALWMGVPVVTLSGRVHRARVGASLLQHVGIEEMVTPSADAYVDTALMLARNPQRLAELRHSLRELVAHSTLTDAGRAVAALESAYRDMWRRCCETGEARASAPCADDPAVRLNIGGTSAKPGWQILNIVAGPAVDHVGDCTDLSRFDTGSVDEVYASHILEHLGYLEEVPTALAEIFRILKPAGKLRVSVPDFDVLCRLYMNPEQSTRDAWKIVRIIYGGQVDRHDFHKIGFSDETLRRFLLRAGFDDINRVEEFGIFDDTSSLRVNGRLISLNVEARKPG